MWGAISGLAKWLAKDKWRAACLVALAVLAVQSWRVESWKDDAVKWKEAATAYKKLAKMEASNHQQTKDNFKAAAAQAARKQKAARDAAEKRYGQLAKDNEERHAQTLDRYRRLSDDYIRTHRVLGSPEAGAGSAGAGGGTLAATDRGSAGNPDGARGETQLVTVTADDVRICTVNTARLEDARDWALGLNPP